MTKHIIRFQITALIFVMLIVISCNGQSSSTSSNKNPKTSPPIIVGKTPVFPQQTGVSYQENLVAQYIRCIFQDSKGHFWFGPAGESVVRYDGSTLRYFDKPTFFKGNIAALSKNFVSVHAIEEDRDRNLWFGTDQGIVVYNGGSFRSYNAQHGLTSSYVGRGSILNDKSGITWVGTKAGVFTFDPTVKKPSFIQFEQIPSTFITDIFEDSSGIIWIATREEGVFRYDGNEIKNYSDIKGLGDNVAGGIAEDKAGKIWFTTSTGICSFDGSAFSQYTFEDGIGGSEIWGLSIEHSGIIWITARGATTRFNPSLPASDTKRFKIFTPTDGMNCCVQSMHVDRSGETWFGTGQGIYRFDGEKLYQVKRDGPW